MSYEIVAAARVDQGTGASRRLRNAGRVPAIIYGGKGDPVTIDVDHNEIYHQLKREDFHAAELKISIGKKSEKVRLQAVQWHPWKELVLHIDFQRV